MSEQELCSPVKRMVLELTGQPNTAAPAKAVPVTAAAAAGGCLDGITKTDLRRQYLIKNPRNDPAFLDLKPCILARLDLEWADTHYKTIPTLRIRADHAAAQDSVFSHVDDALVEKNSFVPAQTLCQNKDEYLIRPDWGRRFDEINQAVIKKILGQNSRVVLAMGDGLSSAAVETNAVDCIQAARTELKTYGSESGPVLFIEYCRVGASDHIGKLTDAEAVYLLVGEQPGPVTAESMFACLTYRPHIGIPESKRTVTSDVRHQGTTAAEAGAHIAELTKTVLEKEASGIDLR